ncbi:nitrite reductase [bacterium]|nr:MAG: nitrite reductase [bacterium]
MSQPKTATHCPYCAMQCGMNLTQHEGNWVVEARDFPTNRGGMCRKGWTSVALLESPQRLTSPLLRREKDAPLQSVSWDEALDFIVGKVEQIQDKWGRDAVGVFGGGGLTNEKAYLLGKFARVVLKTANIDYNGRFCMASAAAAGNKAFGIDRGLPFPMQDIAQADAVLLIGSNIAETMPPIMQWFEKLRENGGKLIVVDPRATPTAQNADYHLQITPGTDLVLANGLLHIAIEEGLLDEAFIATRTTDFECARRAVASYWPARVERITGVDEANLRDVTRLLARANSMFLTARGAEQHANGTETVLGFINLALGLGKAGKFYNGYGCLTGQGNGQGGREHGQKADQLPGYRKIENETHRREVAAHWGISPDELPRAGKSAYELLDSMGEADGLRALFVMGSNVAVSSPSAGKIRRKLAALELLVVSDLFLSETAELADVVLPATQWAEEQGTMTNLEGRVLLRNQAKTPPEGVWSDAQFLNALAKRWGQGERIPSEPRVIFDELRRVTKGALADYSGITYERITQNKGVFWPCRAGYDDTPRLFHDRFAHPDGRARFHDVQFFGLPEEPDTEYPFFFTTGRVMSQYQSGTQTRRIPELNAMSGPPFVELHPDLALEMGISEGDMVRVTSRRGSATGCAKISDGIRADTLFMPFHWGGHHSANLLTIPALDPTSKMPEFKVCAAKIEKATEVERDS